MTCGIALLFLRLFVDPHTSNLAGRAPGYVQGNSDTYVGSVVEVCR